MPLESATYINDLVATNPAATDSTNQGDDHLRLIKSAIKSSLPGLTGALTRAISGAYGTLVGDGAAGTPSYAFLSEPGLGFYRSAGSTIFATGNFQNGGTIYGNIGSFSGALTTAAALTAANATVAGTVTAGSVVVTNLNATTVNAGTVKGALPAGFIMDFAGPNAPSGWFPCDGWEISRTDYAELFAAINTTWGAGNGSTTFNIPNLITRFRRHRDNSGVSGGVGTVQGSQNQSHSHTYSATTGNESVAHSHNINFMSQGADRDHTHTFSGTTASMNRSNPHSHPFSRGGVNTSTTGGGAFGVMASLTSDTTGTTDINHEHAFSGTTSGFNTTHFHQIFGDTGGESANHTHNVSGTTSAGSVDGAEARPVSATILTCIKVYN